MSDPIASATPVAQQQRLLLLRHGEVASHRGDVPVTDAGLEVATDVGRRLGAEHATIRVLTGATLRTRQTGQAIAEGARAAGATVIDPEVAFALRNPDLYVAGVRVDMVSSAASLAAQVPGLSEAEAAAVPFFAGFFDRPDRIGWWLRLSPEQVPGEIAPTVATRIDHFLASLADRTTAPADLTVAVSHSPVLRSSAVAHLDHDPGELAYVTGLDLSIDAARTITAGWYPAVGGPGPD